MTCSCCGARATMQRTSFCARCLLLGAGEHADSTILETADEAPPCELLSIIGDSPRATTFLGEQTWPVRRLVALKLFKQHPPGMDASGARGVPRHPGIAPVLEMGRIGDRAYVMTEYFGGGMLPRCYDRYRLDAAARVNALLAIADALAVAHRAGTPHGRLTASNLVCDSRPPYSVRVVDFGGTPAGGHSEAEFERLTRADLDGLVMVADTLLNSRLARVPSSVDLIAELRRLRTTAQWAPDLRQALAALAAKIVEA